MSHSGPLDLYGNHGNSLRYALRVLVVEGLRQLRREISSEMNRPPKERLCIAGCSVLDTYERDTSLLHRLSV